MIRPPLLLATCAVFLAVAGSARADDIGVTRVGLFEEENGATLLVYAPAPIARLLSTPVRLGRGPLKPVGMVQTAGGSALRFELEPLTPGTVLHLPWRRPAILLEVEWLDGETERRFLRRSATGIRIEVDAFRETEPGVRERASAAVMGGAAHTFGSPLHWAFLLALGLLAHARRALGLVTLFLAGQLAAVALSALTGGSVAAGPAEMTVVVLAVFVGRQALSEDRDGGDLEILTVLAGLVHGLSLDLEVPAALRFASALGTDAAHLGGLAIVLAVGALPATLRRGAAFTLAGLSVSILLLFAIGNERVVALVDRRTMDEPVELEFAGGEAAGSAAPAATVAVAPPREDVAVQHFLVIEPFEIRQEVLVRPALLAGWVELGIPDTGVIGIEQQPALKERVVAVIREHAALRSDGESAPLLLDRVDFVHVGPKGTLPRSEAVPEPVAEARIGVVFAGLLPGMPESVELSWDLFGDADTVVPLTVTDPEGSETVDLVSGASTRRWENRLQSDPLPRIEAVAVEPPRLAVPLLSVPLALLSLVLLIRVGVRRRGLLAFAAGRALLALALFTGTMVAPEIAAPVLAGSEPSPKEAQRVLSALLGNVYRSFSYRTEGAVYERLALSVAGDALEETYLEHREALSVVERGGARARVEAVEVTDCGNVKPTGDGGFEVTATWTVGGSVSHFGHRHFRQNAYEARVRIESLDGVWKIRSVDVSNKRRTL